MLAAPNRAMMKRASFPLSTRHLVVCSCFRNRNVNASSPLYCMSSKHSDESIGSVAVDLREEMDSSSLPDADSFLSHMGL